jgi:ABC-type uncharacterized transport system ATPase subunit
MAFAVEMKGISKRFGAVVANDDVSLSVKEGSIHAIVGENGAGKTTLMRVLYGLYRPDGGSIAVFGKPAQFKTPQDAIGSGIGMVSQHYAIIPELTTLDNLILGAEGGFVVPREEARVRAEKLAHQLGFTFDWSAEASTLSPAACQKLEILKLLWRGARVMVLDEPTAMLSPEDAEALFANLRRLANEGRTILLVTHRLSEVMENCDRVTVMRAGRKVAEADVSDTDAEQLTEWIVGERMPTKHVVAAGRMFGKARLMVSSLTVRGERGNTAVSEGSFTVGEGEILGIAGVDGSGQRELVQALFGLRPYAGHIALDEASLDGLPTSKRLALGLRLIPEDRREEGVILDWPLQDNAILGLQRSPLAARGASIDRKKEAAIAREVLERFSTKAEGLSSPMSSLSGGNQQRFVAGRALHGDPSALVAFQPTRGLDIRGSRDVFDAIRQGCARGMSALVISFDLDELLDNCDRILVMFGGRVIEPPEGYASDRHTVGRLMVGLEP